MVTQSGLTIVEPNKVHLGRAVENIVAEEGGLGIFEASIGQNRFQGVQGRYNGSLKILNDGHRGSGK